MRRLTSARKVWKVFTNTLQSKLHKLNTSKAIKKPTPPKGRSSRTGRRVSWPAFSLQYKRRKRKFNFKTAGCWRQKSRYYHPVHLMQKKPSAVYIDQLFVEPVHEIAAREGCKELSSSCRNEREVVDDHQQDGISGTSKQDWDENETMHSADDMWESMVLASPQMHGINERAEEFIARFRAEMQQQEMLARQ